MRSLPAASRTPPATPAPPSSPGYNPGTSLPGRGLLAEARLEEYYQVLADNGYDDVAYLRSMSEGHADEMAKTTRMKPGHLMRFHSIVRHDVGD